MLDLGIEMYAIFHLLISMLCLMIGVLTLLMLYWKDQGFTGKVIDSCAFKCILVALQSSAECTTTVKLDSKF